MTVSPGKLYNQFRYQLEPADGSDRGLSLRARPPATDMLRIPPTSISLLGAEHRFSPNTIGIVRAGAQFHDVDDGDNYTSPYVEFALNSQVNQQFSVRSFARYGIEDYDTVQY